MIFPDTLKIGAHTYKIRLIEFTDSASGDQDPQKGEIRINKDDPTSEQGATFIHEILHACNATLGSTELGHALIESLSQQLYQVLMDNNLLRE